MPHRSILNTRQIRALSSLLISSLALAPIPALAQSGATPAPQAIDPRWMIADSAAKRVTFDLVAGLTPFNGGLNFNGFRDGELTFVVPTGWSIVVNFINQDGSLPHSLEVIGEKLPVPIRGVPPALPGGASRAVDAGIARGTPREQLRFAADTVGNYLLFCAVPGHGAAGMWLRFKVDRAATAPSMVITSKGTGR